MAMARAINTDSKAASNQRLFSLESTTTNKLTRLGFLADSHFRDTGLRMVLRGRCTSISTNGCFSVLDRRHDAPVTDDGKNRKGVIIACVNQGFQGWFPLE